MLLASTLRLLGFIAGALLQVFLAVLLARKRGGGRVDKLALAAWSAGGLWHAASAAWQFHKINVGAESSLLAHAATAGLALAPAFLLHLSVAWAGLGNALAAPAYLLAAAGWWSLEAGQANIYPVGACASLVAAAALCLRAARRSREDFERRFFLWFALTLAAVAAAGALAGVDSAAVALASLAPPVAFAWFAYRYHLMNVLISQRVIFALTLGVVCAFYLFVVRRVTGFFEEEYQVFGPLTEVALIFAAALVWIPLYGWMTRFLSKRGQLYADFSKRLIEEAARILNLRERLQFLAEEVRRTFELRRVLLVVAGEPELRGESGARALAVDPGALAQLEQTVRARRLDLVRPGGPAHPELARLGFNYLFPLWYEDRLTGLLLLDTTPRVFLDENESLLLGLSRQISHSIETCHVIQQKIGLEKALAEQEHLASLGKVAATIAHEIKNPLSSIKTLAQLMREDQEVEQRYARDLAYMIGEIDRLNRSVQQLLSFSRPLPEQQNEVDVTALLEAVAHSLARDAACEQVRVEHAIAPGLRLARASPEILKQIVLNLALNAVQASEAGGRVLLEAEPGPGVAIALAVSDQGPGIPPEVRERIFEPFFTTKQRGTGLGLAIVRKNVRHLGGEIRIESPIAEGRGTRVVVTLPAA
ncbi:MAG: ATP-binding protein [Acidobacteriota bacterium]